MNICIVDRGASIPAKTYGGTERVIWGLGKSLTRLGHTVTYLVRGGSYCPFAEIKILDQEKDLNLQIPEATDVVHLNYQPAIPLEKPYLITMHGNPSPSEILDHNLVFISNNQAERHNSEVFVHNGLDWDEYPSPDLLAERNYTHFLGKASWKIKNAQGAIAIARKAEKKIYILGGERWSFSNAKRGFSNLFNSNLIYGGMVDDAEKIRIMERSQALIFPVKWHEPFGLAIIESLYAGCAVFGSKNGSLPELITPEVGYCGTTIPEVAEALSRFSFDPEYCHEYANENFDAMSMTRKYLLLYQKVIKGEKLNPVPPEFDPIRNTVEPFN